MLIPMIDTLAFGLDIENYQEGISKYADELLRLKETAKEYSLHKLSEKATITIDEVTFKVLANGKEGYAFILHNSEYELNLAQFRSNKDNFYPVKVRIKSECLWSKGVEDAYQFIYERMSRSFGNIVFL